MGTHKIWFVCEKSCIKVGSSFGCRSTGAHVCFIAWHGVDTLILTAGVSALQPLMSVAGVDMSASDIAGSQASPEGIQHAVDTATAAVHGNFIGPYVAATSFVRPFTLF